ncbi:MAG: aminotransferase class III-fold pyridoxal phosphate-dependent enzyme [Gammaproteobacteria bacterium]|nr:aminotransferase class III-fold pyridoxal phosphate-dependent enzyme [Gammaproteobacteria bacterium]
MARQDTALEDLEKHVHEAYEARTTESAAWYQRASQSLAGGVTGSVRYFAPYPLYFENGAGAHMTDIDGNRYIDCLLGNGCLLLGHRHADMVASRKSCADKGSLLLNPKNAAELAEQMQRMVPGAQRVRLVNSGTEAVMSAMRFARAFTSRDVILKFVGAYHGMEDQVLVGLDARRQPASAGIPERAVAQTELVSLLDLDEVRERLAKGDVAAVLLDPTMHQSGMWVGDAQTYAALKQMTAQAGTLLIFDEVISGFRLAPGGAQEYFGVTADLAVFAKALAAGEKLGAITGRADVMNVADPSSKRAPGPFAFQSGTSNDATTTLVAAQTALNCYRELGERGGYTRVFDLSQRLSTGLRDAFTTARIPCHINLLGPMLRMSLTDRPQNFEQATRTNRKLLNLFHLSLITEGVLTLPGVNDFFVSFAHTEADIDDIIGAAKRALEGHDFTSAMT